MACITSSEHDLVLLAQIVNLPYTAKLPIKEKSYLTI